MGPKPKPKPKPSDALWIERQETFRFLYGVAVGVWGGAMMGVGWTAGLVAAAAFALAVVMRWRNQAQYPELEKDMDRAARDLWGIK